MLIAIPTSFLFTSLFIEAHLSALNVVFVKVHYGCVTPTFIAEALHFNATV